MKKIYFNFVVSKPEAASIFELVHDWVEELENEIKIVMNKKISSKQKQNWIGVLKEQVKYFKNLKNKMTHYTVDADD